MRKFLFLYFLASGILLSEANGANLKRSKFTDFNTGRSVIDCDNMSTELSPTLDYENSDNVCFLRPQTEIFFPKPIKSHKFYTIVDSEEEDENIFNVSESDLEMPEAPANTPYKKTPPKEHDFFDEYSRNFSTLIANDAF